MAFAVIVCLLTAISASRCMFDAVKPKRVVQTNISYSVMGDSCINNGDRCKRDAFSRQIVEAYFQPIRIHAYFSSFTEINIDATQRTRLTSVIGRLVSTASHIFSGMFYILYFIFVLQNFPRIFIRVWCSYSFVPNHAIVSTMLHCVTNQLKQLSTPELFTPMKHVDI